MHIYMAGAGCKVFSWFCMLFLQDVHAGYMARAGGYRPGSSLARACTHGCVSAPSKQLQHIILVCTWVSAFKGWKAVCWFCILLLQGLHASSHNSCKRWAGGSCPWCCCCKTLHIWLYIYGYTSISGGVGNTVWILLFQTLRRACIDQLPTMGCKVNPGSFVATCISRQAYDASDHMPMTIRHESFARTLANHLPTMAATTVCCPWCPQNTKAYKCG